MKVVSYRVRVLFIGGKEVNYVCTSYDDAKEKFMFFVSACLEFGDLLTVRCINIFRNKTSIKLFQNYTKLY